MSSSPPSRIGHWLRAAVLVGSGLCLGWVLWPIWRHARELGASVDSGGLAAGLTLGALTYALLSICPAAAWWWLAGIYGHRPSLRRGYAVWARAQIAKYLPGNVFHYVSRQLLGRQLGLSHAALVASGLLEMGSLLLAALLIAIAGATLTRTPLPVGLSLPALILLAAGGLLTWPAVDRLLRRWQRSAEWMADLPQLSVWETARLLGPSLLLHLIFFLGTGAVLVGLIGVGWKLPETDARQLIWLYAVAWAAGTVTVGAPGGMGVREAILTLQLGPILGVAHAAAVAVALRIVTLCGDLLTAIAGWALERQRRGLAE